jgi:hypothetical protein
MMKQGTMLKHMIKRKSLTHIKDNEDDELKKKKKKKKNGLNQIPRDSNQCDDSTTQDDLSGRDGGKEGLGDWSADEGSVDDESVLIDEKKDERKLSHLPNPFSLAGSTRRKSVGHAMSTTLDKFDGDLAELGIQQKHTWRADKSKSITMGETPDVGDIMDSFSSENDSEDSSGSDYGDSDTDAVIMGSMDEEGQSVTGSKKGKKKKKKGKSKKKKKKKLKRSSIKSKSRDDGSIKSKSRDDGSIKSKSRDDGSIKSKSRDDGSIKSKSRDDGSIKSKSRDDGSTKSKSRDDGSPKSKSQEEGAPKRKSRQKGFEGPKRSKSHEEGSVISLKSKSQNEGSGNPAKSKSRQEGSLRKSGSTGSLKSFGSPLKSKSREEGSLRKSGSSDKRKKKKKSKSEVMAYNEAAKQAAGVVDEKIAEQMPSENDVQKNDILKLQQQLSDALHKVVATTEEQIQDKDNFLKVSTEVAELKAQVAELGKARDVAQNNIGEKDAAIEEKDTRIQKLEAAVERQLDLQDELEMKLERSEDEIEKILHEIEELETGNGDVGAGSRVLKAQLDLAKASLNEKQKELDEYTERLEYLEKEMEEGNNVNKLQVNEMEEINTALQGKLKGERLDAAAKLSRKDEVIGKLQMEIDDYRRTDDVKDLVSAKERINANELELDEIKTEMDEALAQIAKISGEKEDLVERIDVLGKQTKILNQDNKELNAKAQKSHLQVLEWTEKTYDWKSRAETAEKKLRDLNEEDSESGDAAPQGMFLQAVMDTQQAKQARGSGAGLRRSVMNTLFKKVASDDDTDDNDDLTAEQIRIKNLEERNESLDTTIAGLRSDLVKMQSAHKDKLYTLEKQVDQLQRENEALKKKNHVLEQPPTHDSVEI